MLAAPVRRYARMPIAASVTEPRTFSKWIQTVTPAWPIVTAQASRYERDNLAAYACDEAMSVPGILVDHRLIADGDELALLPAEVAAFAGSVLKVRRASGAARIVARMLLSRFGREPYAIPKSTAGMPVWPDGIVGSLAHEKSPSRRWRPA